MNRVFFCEKLDKRQKMCYDELVTQMNLENTKPFATQQIELRFWIRRKP